MKRFFFLVAILLCTVSGAQERFSCRFKMVERESGKTIAEGKGYVQGDCYRLETEWMQVWCNGKDRWIWSSSSEELVIEPNDVSFLKDIDVNRLEGNKVQYSQIQASQKNLLINCPLILMIFNLNFIYKKLY